MARVLIETYRSWDIWFETNSERFIAENGVNENEKGKPTLAAARKFVDEFRKANAEFKPFEVIAIGGYGKSYGKKIRIIGIRKDGRFVSENEKGEKGQVSDYDEKDWAISNPGNDAAMLEAARLDDEADAIRKSAIAIRGGLVWSTLRDFKKTQDYSDFVA